MQTSDRFCPGCGAQFVAPPSNSFTAPGQSIALLGIGLFLVLVVAFFAEVKVSQSRSTASTPATTRQMTEAQSYSRLQQPNPRYVEDTGNANDSSSRVQETATPQQNQGNSGAGGSFNSPSMNSVPPTDYSGTAASSSQENSGDRRKTGRSAPTEALTMLDKIHSIQPGMAAAEVSQRLGTGTISGQGNSEVWKYKGVFGIASIHLTDGSVTSVDISQGDSDDTSTNQSP